MVSMKQIGRPTTCCIIWLLLFFIGTQYSYASSDSNYFTYVAQQVYENCNGTKTEDGKNLTIEYILERLREFENSSGSRVIHAGGGGSGAVYMRCKDFTLSYLNGNYYTNGIKITAPLIYQNAENIHDSNVNQTAMIGTDRSSFWKNILSSSILQVVGVLTTIVLGYFITQWLRKHFGKR